MSATAATTWDGPAAPPRRNGELAFDEPWQARAFAVAQAVVEACFAGDREPFRRLLIAAIAAEPDRPYWDSWAAALEELVVAAGLVERTAVDRHAMGDLVSDGSSHVGRLPA